MFIFILMFLVMFEQETADESFNLSMNKSYYLIKVEHLYQWGTNVSLDSVKMYSFSGTELAPFPLL